MFESIGYSFIFKSIRLSDQRGCFITKNTRTKGGGRQKVKDKELKLKETEASHTLGGAGECRLQGKVIYAPLLMKFKKKTFFLFFHTEGRPEKVARFNFLLPSASQTELQAG
jgi:hypothetical protein